MVDILGFREHERVISDDDGSVVASFMSVTNLSHDIAIVPEPTDMRLAAPPCLLPLHFRAAPLRCGGTGKGSPASRSNTDPPGMASAAPRSLHAGARWQSHPAHGRSRLHDFRSGLEDRGLEGIGGSRCRRYLDRIVLPDSFWNYGTPAEERLAIPTAAAA